METSTFRLLSVARYRQRLEQPISGLDKADSQPEHNSSSSPESADKRQVELLKSEVERMKYLLDSTERDHEEKMQLLILEEKQMKEENTRLRRRLQQEAERREEICRNLSESESSLEIDTERYWTLNDQSQNLEKKLFTGNIDLFKGFKLKIL